MIIQTKSKNTTRLSVRVDGKVYTAVFRDGRAEVQENVGKLLTKMVSGITVVKESEEDEG